MVAILQQITAKRAQDIAQRGFTLGYDIPQERLHPLIKPPLDSELIIAEIKRASPSAGEIGSIDEPVALAGAYLNGGAGAISVLCEERHFRGSLADLMAVKAAYPNACVLRKDFIQYPEEIAVSYRAGADMVLLIAAMFEGAKGGFRQLEILYNECLRFGITPLLEVHNACEIDFIAPLQARLVGINARNLHTFDIDVPSACALRGLLGDGQVIFESGISSPHLAFMVGSVGFGGVLCGSYLVAHTNPTHALQELKSALCKGRSKQPRFYNIVFEHLARKQLMLKVCGITSLDDALMLLELDERQDTPRLAMLGFIFAKNSPRCVESKQAKDILKALQTLYPNILRVGVVDDDRGALEVAKNLYDEGLLDALQLHGLNRATPRIFAAHALESARFCHYVAQNIASAEDFCPEYDGICLLDSQSAQGGGSGKRIDMEVLRELALPYLCLAGGIGAANLAEILSLKPALLDINSSIESRPGKKDKAKFGEFLECLGRYV